MAEPIQHETRISGQFAAYDNDGTLKMLLDIITVLVTQILAWIDDPHRTQVHLMVDRVNVMMPLLIELITQFLILMPLVTELVRQILVLVLLLIEILSMVLCIMTSIGIIINACLDWCGRRYEDTHFLITGHIGVYA